MSDGVLGRLAALKGASTLELRAQWRQLFETELPRNTADTVTVRIDFSVRQRGGKKLIIVPDGEPTWAPPRAHIDNTLVKALARAFRWRKLLETGVYATLAELAAAEKINPSYLSQILRLTLLAPQIVESILDGRHPAGMTLAALMRPFAMGWRDQVEALL